MTDQQKTILIRKNIIEASRDFRLKHSFLKHQDLIGGLIFTISICSIILGSFLYLKGQISFWILIPWNAFWMGILHEMEHDLIHYMYFKKHPWISNLFLGLGWMARPLTINPWFRRELHFHHHKYSGTIHDVEERGVTNGESWGIKRFLTTPDLLLGGILRAMDIKRDIISSVKSGKLSKDQALRFKFIKTYGLLPFSLFLYLIWYVFLIHSAIIGLQNLIGFEYHSPIWISNLFLWITPLVIILIAPNILRQFCLHFITSNLHYYGDVDSGNIMQQTQILNIWWTYPMQIFCFFFGHTHAIHHFHVNETFYIRHFTRKKSWKVMKENGVRFNDLGTFKRANRFGEKLIAEI